jgi:hypothetical protein
MSASPLSEVLAPNHRAVIDVFGLAVPAMPEALG